MGCKEIIGNILRTIWIAHTNYHAQMDMDALLIGESYDRLPDTYAIFICDCCRNGLKALSKTVTGRENICCCRK